MTTFMIVRTTPMIGVRGINGHRMIITKLIVPPSIIVIQPANSNISLEKKPTMRETRRSINI